MKEQSRKQSRDKTREKNKRHRKEIPQKQVDNLIETIDDFTIHLSQVIGEGTYGRVYKASKTGSQEQFACKFIKQDRIDDLQIYYSDKKVAQQLAQRLRTEGQFQLKLSKCPYIARMFKTQKNDKGFYFIMEYCETDLAKLLKKLGFFPEQLALKYFRQIVQGIKYIYERNAFHRDLKPENLLLKKDTIKISDFGFVKIFTQIQKQCKSRRNRFETQSKVGTFRYMSPDILALLQAENKQGKVNSQIGISSESNQQNSQTQSKTQIQSKYDPEKSDVWSLGIILYKMLYGKEPYDGRSFQQMIKKIKQQKLDFPGSIQFPPGKIVKTKVSKDVIKLIKKMLTPDQNERINFMKLYSRLNLVLEQKQKQKLRSGIEKTQQNLAKGGNDEATRNKKERLLNVYNKIMVRLYKDLSTFATLREIGFQDYSQFSYKIMTLLHEKRTAYLETEDDQQDLKSIRKKKVQSENIDVDEKVKQQISQYHNIFYEQIKTLSYLKPEDNLQNLLILVYKNLASYEDFELLIKEVQLFLLFLLQLCCLEIGIIKEDYICATEDKAESLKSKSILNFKDDAVKLIADYLKGGEKKQFKTIQLPKQPTQSQNPNDRKSDSRHKQRQTSKSKHTKDKSEKKERNHSTKKTNK